ncbi:MAG: hypothetical protein GY928_11480 [Colwellia sp.]|nr:hypothetical protein [Colwellia sp.]
MLQSVFREFDDFDNTGIVNDDLIRSEVEKYFASQNSKTPYATNQTIDTLANFNSRLGLGSFTSDLLKETSLGLGLVTSVGQTFDNNPVRLSTLFDGGYKASNFGVSNYLALGDTSSFTNSLSFADVLDNNLVRGLGHLGNAASPLLSFAQLSHYEAETNGQAADLNLYKTKFAVDSTFAVLALTGPVGSIAAGTYGAADFLVQGSSYTTQYHNPGTQLKDWSAVWGAYQDSEYRNYQTAPTLKVGDVEIRAN